MVACELLVPRGLTMDISAFTLIFFFYVFFLHCMVYILLFSLVHLSLTHTLRAQHTDNTDFFSHTSPHPFLLFPLPWIAVGFI